MVSAYRHHLLASTLFVAANLLAGAAFAQDAGSSPTGSAASSGAAVPTTQDVAAQSGDAGAPPQDVVVTGSRIMRPDLASSSPVSSISGEALKVSNAVTVEQILNVNPQFQPSQTASSNNPGTGAATIDLRGLGSNRTLVLIDGKRAPAFDTTGDVDVNIIPTALIKRVDILTGGASAVYGSDAVAGVVNFVLDDRFKGLRVDGSSQISTLGDAGQRDVSVTGGVKLGDRGNLVGSFNYSSRDLVTYGDRPALSQALDSTTLQPTGSSNTVPTAFDIPGAGRQQIRSDGTLSRSVSLYNYEPVNIAVVPLERLSGMVLGRYEITDHVEAYVRANYEHLDTVTTLAPTATAGFAFDIYPSNPFLTASEQNAFFNTAANPNLAINPDGSSTIGIRRRMIETGGRVEQHTTNSYQIVGGLRGAIGSSDFTYDVFGQYGRVERHDILENDLSYNALSQALDAVAGPNGTVVCRDQSNGCVPLNLFTTATIPQSQLAFVLRNALQDTTVQQTVAGANVSGNLDFLKSPFAQGPAAISVGVEYRREQARTTVSDDYASGDLIYYGQGQNIAGSFDTKDAYVEAKMPLVQDKPFIHALDVEGGFRYSHYSTVGDVYTYKGGGDYSPVDGVRFRGIYQRAVRAPNVGELFSPVVAATGSLPVDPCSGTVSATTQTICISQGAPSSAFRNGVSTVPQPVAAQINIFSGGNPKLAAEKTDTYTVGVVVNPPHLRALSIAFDYYNINIGNAVGATPASVLVNQCFAIDQNAASAACSSIKRNPLDGSLSGNIQYGVPQVDQNLSSIQTSGFDLSVGYHGGSQAGFNYTLAYSGNFIRKYTYQPVIGSTTFRCDGNFGGDCDLEPMPRYKHVASAVLGYQMVSFNTRWEYLGPVHEDADTQILVSRIRPFSYFDETVTINVNEKFSLRFGALNILDKKPPILGDTIGNSIAQNLGNTYANTYDVIGRRVFAGFSANF